MIHSKHRRKFLWGMLWVIAFALLMGQHDWSATRHLQAQTEAHSFDEPVFSLEQYEMNRFEQVVAGGGMELLETPVAPEVLIPWSKVTYQFYENNNYEVYLMNDDGSGQVRLTNHPAHDIHSRLNRDSTKVIFASNRDGDYELYVINSNGTGLQQLTFNNTDDVEPYWSPDGTKVVFQSYRDGQPEIYIMNADGSGQTRLTHDPDYDGMPSWSPDGSKIAFISRRTGGYRVYVMNTNGTGLTQLSNQAYSLHPVWSPDGSKIAYDADGNNDGFQEIWYMNADGSGQTARYVSAAPLEDNLVRSWSPNGQYIAITTVELIYYQGNWYWDDAYVKAIAWQGSAAPFYLLHGNNRAWNPDWQTQDYLPPQSAVWPLPTYQRVHSVIRWSGSDAGISGIAGYDVQYRTGSSWTTWQNNTTATYGWLTSAPVGIPLDLRSRARDGAGNVESWPAHPDASTTLYTWKLTARMTDNRGVTLPHVPVTIAPTPINSGMSDANGLIGAWLKSSGAHTLAVNQSGYKPVAATSLNSEGTHPFYLRPQDDVIVNGTFETTGTPLPGWNSSGSLPASINSSVANTGGRSLSLGATCAYPCLTPGELLASNNTSHNLDMVLDGQGTLHIAWHDEAIQGDGIYYRYRTNNGVWSTPAKIANVTGYAGYIYTNIVIDQQNRLHVVWSLKHQTTYNMMVYYSSKPHNGTWSSPHLLVSNHDSAGDMQVDSQGRVYVLLVSMYYLVRQPNGTWSQPIKIAIDAYPVPPSGVMAIDHEDVVHFVWWESVGSSGQFRIYHQRLLTDGTLLPAVEILQGYAEFNTRIFRLIPGGDVFYLFFTNHYDGYFVRWTRQSGWGTPEPLAHANANVDAVLDENNVLHVMSFDRSTNEAIYRQRSPQQGWSQPVILGLTWTGGTKPKIVITSQNMIHMVIEVSYNFTYFTSAKSPDTQTGQVQQVVTIPGTMINPTLAFMHKGQIDLPGDASGLSVVINNGVVTQTVATPLVYSDWHLTWVDMSAWVGETVTVTFKLHQQSGEHYLRLYLDDISLGSSYPDTWLTLSGPATALPGTTLAMIMSYGNRGDLIAQSNRITVTLPAHISFVTASVSPVSTQPLVWDVGDLAGGSNPTPIVVTLMVQGSAPTMVTRSISAQLRGQTPEVALGNNQPVYLLFLGAKQVLPIIYHR